MATHEYHKMQQPLGSHKPGSNWFFIRVDFTKQNCASGDVLKLMEVKNHWILKSGFSRVSTAANGAATGDFGTSSAGNEIDADIDLDSATDTWLRSDTLDDDGPIALTADGFLYLEVKSAACSSGIIDLMIEIIIPHDNVDAVDSLGE